MPVYNYFIIYSICLSFLSFPIVEADDFQEYSTFEDIINEPYLDVKLQLGEKLANYKTAKSKHLLKLLLSSTYHWNREAGVSGIFILNEKELKKSLISQFLIDPILRPRIQKGIIKNFELYENELILAYKKETTQKNKKLLLNLIIISPRNYIIHKIN